MPGCEASARQFIAPLTLAFILCCPLAVAAESTESTTSPGPAEAQIGGIDDGSWWWAQYQQHGHRSPRWDDLVQSACEMVDKRWAGAAVQTLREARMKGCDGPVVRMMMGHLGFWGGMTSGEAEDLVLNVASELQGNPTQLRLYVGCFESLSAQYRKNGQHRKAADALREAIAACPPEMTNLAQRLRQELGREEYLAEWERKIASVADEIAQPEIPETPEFKASVLGALKHCAKVPILDYEQALRVSETAVNRWPEDPEFATCHVWILDRLRLWSQAEEFGLHAIQLAENSGDKRILFNALHALQYTIVDHSHNDKTVEGQRRLRKYDKEGVSRRMLAVAEEVGEDEVLYFGYHARARSTTVKEDPYEAVEYFKKALEIAVKNGWEDRIHYSKFVIGMTYAARDCLEEAQAWAKEADIAVHPYVALKQGDWEQVFGENMSRVLAEDAETLRQPNERLMLSSVGWNARDAYDFAVVAALHTDRTAEAVEMSERFHNRTLGTILGARLDEPRTMIVAEYENEQEDLTHQMDNLRAQLALAEKDSETATSIQRDLEVHGAAMATLMSKIEVEEMEIHNARMPRYLSVSEMQGLLDADTALLIYQVTWAPFVEDGMIAVVTKDDCHAMLQDQLAIGRHPDRGIMAKIQAYREVAADPDPTLEMKLELPEREAVLFDLLVAPVEDLVAEYRRIVIVPCGPLQQLPIHLLRNRSGRSLLDDHSISYAQSAGTLKYCLARNRRLSQNAIVTAVADPTIPEEGSRLRFALSEAESIRGVFPDMDLLAGDRATETAVKRALTQADVLHFACHGLLDPEFPMKSALALTPDEKNDGFLTAREVCDFPVKAGLVVLSACHSGSGALSLGCIEMIGMSRAWLLAGAPSVVVSLWKIDDRATSELMAEFYGNLKSMSRAEALRQAQLTMRERYDSPYHWGAFVLYGDYR
jgi:tetratricopeptide (TPR) repeat protein